MYKLLAIATIALTLALSAPAQDRFPWITAERYVYDHAGLLDEAGVRQLEARSAEPRSLFAVPLFAVTVTSPAEYGGQGLQPDAYAQALLEALAGASGNTGASDKAMLILLVQENDEVRIAVGNAWPSDFFTRTRSLQQQIQDDFIQKDLHVEGLLEGIARMTDLVQETAQPGLGILPIALAAGGCGLALLALAGLVWWRRSAAATAALPDAVLQGRNSRIVRELKKGANPDALDEQGYNAAIYAAIQGDVSVLGALHAHGAKLGLGTAQGETPLYYAAQHGHLEATRFLLKNGVPVDPETVHRETPLLIAAREGHAPVVRVLLEAGANVNQQDNRGWTALMIALRENHTDLMNLLLGHNVDVNLAPKDGAHALMMAVKQEDEDLVRRLLERGADVHHTDRDGMCALRIAVLRGNQAIARRLLNAGADVTAPFANKETPVQCAEREGHKELAAYLKKRVKRLAACMDILEVVARGDLPRIKEIVVQVPNSVNVHSKRTRWTPLLIAVRAQQLEIAETLLEHGADVHARSTEGKAAIAYAVDADNLAMVKVLLEGGARIDQVDPTGIDLRDYAEQQGRESIVAFIDSFRDQQAAGHALFLAVQEDDPPKAMAILKERPLCVDARTRNDRWSPLLHAARANNLPMARLLLEFNAQVNLPNNRGMTALMYAARNGNIELVRLLLNKGADVRMRSREGNTACEFALNQGHVRVVMLLQEVEAQLADFSRAGLINDVETVADLAPVDGQDPAVEKAAGESARGDGIFKAILENNITLAKQILQDWPDCVGLRRGPSELTPLHLAINAGLYTLAELLLDAGADANALSRDCKTPLYQAVARADVNLVSLLLNRGARVWQVVQGQTALQVAQAAGYDDIVEELTRAPEPQAGA